MNDPRIRALLLFLLVITFGVLIFGGVLIHRQKPPVPAVVRSEGGEVLFTGDDIKSGQKLYLSRGGQDMGTIWGHGSYLAPDWSADYLHRSGLFLAARDLGIAADTFAQSDFDALPEVRKAQARASSPSRSRRQARRPPSPTSRWPWACSSSRFCSAP